MFIRGEFRDSPYPNNMTFTFRFVHSQRYRKTRSDIFLFPNVQKNLRGKCFPSPEAKVKMEEAILKDLSKKASKMSLKN